MITGEGGVELDLVEGFPAEHTHVTDRTQPAAEANATSRTGPANPARQPVAAPGYPGQTGTRPGTAGLLGSR